MFKIYSSYSVVFLASAMFLYGCSSIQHESVQKRTSHFMCLSQDKSTEHYSTNTFTVEPTSEQKQYEVLLVKRNMEKQLKIKLVDCREIAVHDMPSDLNLPEKEL